MSQRKAKGPRVEDQTSAEERALLLLGTYIRACADKGPHHQKAEMAALYLCAKAYTLDNKFDDLLMRALDNRAEQIVEGWEAERKAGER